MRDSSHVPRPRNFMIEKLVFIRRFPCELPQATLTPPLSRAEGRFPPTLQNKNPTQGRILILVDGVAHDGSLFGEDGTEAMFFELVLFSAEVGVEPDREDACADQDATEFGEWEQAVPGSCVLDAMAEGDESCSSYDQQDHAEEGLGLS